MTSNIPTTPSSRRVSGLQLPLPPTGARLRSSTATTPRSRPAAAAAAAVSASSSSTPQQQPRGTATPFQERYTRRPLPTPPATPSPRSSTTPRGTVGFTRTALNQQHCLPQTPVLLLHEQQPSSPARLVVVQPQQQQQTTPSKTSVVQQPTSSQTVMHPSPSNWNANRSTSADAAAPSLQPESLPDQAVLPEGWVEVLYSTDDGSQQQPYYVYEPDGATQWERPSLMTTTTTTSRVPHQAPPHDELDGRLSPPVVAEPPGGGTRNNEDTVPASSFVESPVNDEPHDAPLPEGWEKCWYNNTTDDNTENDDGTPYYVYTPDGTTQWERPTTTIVSLDTDTTKAAANMALSESQEPVVVVVEVEESTPLPEETTPPVVWQNDDGDDDGLGVVDTTSAGGGAVAVTGGTEPQTATDTSAPHAQKSTQPLPSGWVELQWTNEDDGTTVPYYLYEPDGTTTWDRPEPTTSTHTAENQVDDDHHSSHNGDDELVAEAEQPETKDGSSPPPPLTQAQDDIGLPHGWVELLDVDSDTPYYLYEPDGSTTWERPTVTDTIEEEIVPVQPAVDAAAAVADTMVMDDSSRRKAAAAVDADVTAMDDSVPLPNENMTTVVHNNDDSATAFDALLLPLGWVELLDEGSGMPYYLYEPDGTTQWDHPGVVVMAVQEDTTVLVPSSSSKTTTNNSDDANYDHAAEMPLSTWPEEENEIVQANSSSDANVVAEEEDVAESQEELLNIEPPLPLGWVELLDDASGMPYYLFEAADGTTTTTWDRPTTANNNDEDADAAPEQQQQREQATEFDDGPEEHDLYEQDSPVILTSAPLPHENVSEAAVPDEVAAPSLAELSVDDVVEDYAPALPASLDLPLGWSALVDEATGMTYYFCEADGTTTWDLPTTVNEVLPGGDAAVEKEVAFDSGDFELSPEETDVGDATAEYALEEMDDAQLLPDVDHLKSSAPEDVANTEDEAIAETDVDADENSPPTALPHGWVELIDKTSGMPYFYLEADDTATWERPTLPAADSFAENGATNYYIANVSDMDRAAVALNHDDIDVQDEAMEPADSVPEEVSGDALDKLGPAPEDALEVENSVNDEDEEVSGIEPHQIDDLLSGWTELIDDASGMTYYYCEADGSTSWDRPTVPVAPSPTVGTEMESSEGQANSAPIVESIVDDAAITAESGTEETVSAPEETGQEQEHDLPSGWSEHVDPSSGQAYYVNEATGASSWEWPTETNADTVETVAEDESGNAEFAVGDSVATGLSGDASSELPNGWVEVPDSSSGMSYFYNEAENRTTWDRPVAKQEHRNGFSHAERKAPVVDHSRQRDGRPAHAVASFGFGGRLCLLRPRNVVMIRRTFTVVPAEALARIELSKQQRGLRGPLNSSDDKTVSAYIEDKSSTFLDLLWCLIATVSVSQGRLRGKTGVADPSSPEAMIVKLLLRDYDATGTDGNDELSMPAQNVGNMESNMKSVEQLLLIGQREQAVDEAIASGNFAMALLIATMCGRDTYHHAAKCFADRALSEGQPLHTIALLFSGQLQPSGDGDPAHSLWDGASKEVLQLTWKRHLAVILSNPIGGWDQLVLSLGDRLVSLGEVNAAHFCYMVCGCSVGRPVSPDARMTLLGCDFKPLDLVLATDDSVEGFHRTEAYEWAKRRGNPNATIPSLQPFKVVYAMFLADYGFVQAAKLYIDNVIDCMEITREKMHSAKPAQGPLSLSILTADKNGLLAALNSLDTRLTGRSSPNASSVKAELPEEKEADSSFVTAHTNLNDDTHFTDRSEVLEMPTGKETNKPSKLNIDESVANRQKESMQQKSRVLSPIGEKNSRVARQAPLDQPSGMDSKMPPAMPSLSNKDGVDATKPPPLEHDTAAIGYPQTPTSKISNMGAATASKASKPQSAPMSAPANLESAKKGSTSSKKKGFFSFGIKESVTKWLNPEATQADLGERMQAYYDDDKKVWVFPGEDPAEVARPIGPPPTTPMASTSIPAPSAAASNDPLAAMMAPPQRNPTASRARSSVMRPSPSTMPMMLPLGMMPGTPSAAPKFAVFAPKAENDGKKENEKPADM